MRVSDYGATFTPVWRPPAAISALTFSGPDTGWAVGREGMILKTTTGGITKIQSESRSQKMSKSFQLRQNYPNPFNHKTVISYQLAVGSKAELTIYNLLGQKIRTLVHTSQEAGEHTAVWNGRNQAGNEVGSGVYFYGITCINSTKKQRIVHKLLLLK